MWYFLIGLIYAIATCLKHLTVVNDLDDVNKLLAKMNGAGHWFTYLVIFISRLLFWPAYLVMGFVN